MNIGDIMSDGTIFAGMLPETNKPLYALPEDASLKLTFNKAAEYAAQLNQQNAFGHNDWRVPTDTELNLLYQNKDKGALMGSFNQNVYYQTGWYRSSTKNPDLAVFAHVQRFSDSERVWLNGGKSAYVRCVRG
jgi:hypothetical protein